MPGAVDHTNAAQLLLTALNTLLLIVALYIIGSASFRARRMPPARGSAPATCGALDPVSDPAYNMREITKQSVLLEEHLVEANKFCPDCITKHFLHIIGLAEEGQMLACDQIQRYPLLQESAAFYRALFQQWLRDRQASAAEIAGELRTARKQLIAAYFLSQDGFANAAATNKRVTVAKAKVDAAVE